MQCVIIWVSLEDIIVHELSQSPRAGKKTKKVSKIVRFIDLNHGFVIARW